MGLQQQINIELKQAMLEKDVKKRDFLRVIIGEFNREQTTKELSDDKVLIILKKMQDNAILMKNQYEIDLLSTYLPKMFSNEELNIIIKNIIDYNNYSTIKDMGKVINELKINYTGRFDGGIASSIIKKILI